MEASVRHRVFTSSLAFALWAASMFIHVFDYESRNEVVPIHVYNFYGWVPAILREPHRFIADGVWMAIVPFGIIDVIHIALCYALGALFLRLIYRLTAPR